MKNKDRLKKMWILCTRITWQGVPSLNAHPLDDFNFRFYSNLINTL